MNAVTQNRLLLACYLLILYLFFMQEISFFYNQELILNLIVLSFFVLGFNVYYNSNQKEFVVEKNQAQKENIIFLQTILANWKRFQLRNRFLKKIYLVHFIKHFIQNVAQLLLENISKIRKVLEQRIYDFFEMKFSFIQNELSTEEEFYKMAREYMLVILFVNRARIK